VSHSVGGIVHQYVLSTILILCGEEKDSMAGMRYCGNCKKMVTPKKDFSVLALVILTLIPPWIWGVVYYLVKPNVCPMCNSQNWTVPPQE